MPDQRLYSNYAYNPIKRDGVMDGAAIGMVTGAALAGGAYFGGNALKDHYRNKARDLYGQKKQALKDSVDAVIANPAQHIREGNVVSFGKHYTGDTAEKIQHFNEMKAKHQGALKQAAMYKKAHGAVFGMGGLGAGSLSKGARAGIAAGGIALAGGLLGMTMDALN